MTLTESQLARQELMFGHQFTLDDLLGSIDAVAADDVLRVSQDLFRDGAAVATVVGPAMARGLSMDNLKV